MSTQLRGRRSGAFWSLLFFLTVAALAIGYFLGAQRGSPLPIPIVMLTVQSSATPTATVIGATPTNVPTPILMAGTITYTVQPGDSLSKLARVYGTTVAQIQAGNSMTDDLIHVGQVLRIPSTKISQPMPSDTPMPTLTSPPAMPTVTRMATIDVGINLSTPTPSGIGSNPQLIAQPELVAPEPDYTIIGDIETLFAWKWTGTLAPDQGFEIVFWPLDQPSDKRGIHNPEETQTLTPDADGIYRLSKKVSNQGPGNYEWTVVVVRLNSYQRLVEAPSRPIKIRSSSGSSESEPGVAGPRP